MKKKNDPNRTRRNRLIGLAVLLFIVLIVYTGFALSYVLDPAHHPGMVESRQAIIATNDAVALFIQQTTVAVTQQASNDYIATVGGLTATTYASTHQVSMTSTALPK